MIIMNEKDVEFMGRILPDDYTCEIRKDGVHCFSDKGIADDQGYDDHWDLIINAIRQHFTERFCEVFHQTSTYHRKFTVFLKK